jgi:phosphate-selective porin OprO/OprP
MKIERALQIAKREWGNVRVSLQKISFWRSGIIVVIAAFVVQLGGLNSHAQSTSAQIQELKKQIEAIQQQNQQQIGELRKKIEELEAQKAADQEKIEELATKKEEEDKDAWWKKVEVGYKKPGDGFTIKSKDGLFSLRTRLRTQFQFSINDTDDEDVATDFNVRRFRLIFDGNAFTPWLLYYLQVSADNNGSFSLLDAYFDFAYNTKFVPRPGQYKVPFTREFLNSTSELQLVERSIVNDEFSLGRSRGASIYGVLGNFITYGAGVFNGNGTNGASIDSNMLYAGRIMLTPCCGELKYANSSFPSGGDYKIEPNFGADKPLIAIGVAAAGIPGLKIDDKEPSAAIADRFEQIGATEGDVFSLTADANFKYSRISIEGEFDYRNINPEEPAGLVSSVNDYGVRAQAGFFVYPDFIEIAGRYAQIWYDTDVEGPDTSWQLTPGINFYLSKNHKYKVQLDHSFIRNEFTDSDDIDENIFRAQLQLYF